MTELLIHSMSEFADVITAALEIAKARQIVEIGAEYGGMTARLAEHVQEFGGSLTSIDPAPKQEFLEWAAAKPHVRHVAKPSLEALNDIECADAWIIDGDHNWYTVYHELKQIGALSRRDGKPMLVFLHDVCWPCGRRDSYYAPKRIPQEFRHRHDFHGGVFPDRLDLAPGRGFRGMGQFAWAAFEGGPRNGVKTAIDDFIAEEAGEQLPLAYAEIPAVFGLGVLFAMDAPWSNDVANLLIPYHRNTLLASLEQNRLANYLRVLELQDR